MALRFLAGDLPIIEQALGVFISTIGAQISAAKIDSESPQAELLLDGLESAKRLLARARAEMAQQAAARAAATVKTEV